MISNLEAKYVKLNVGPEKLAQFKSQIAAQAQNHVKAYVRFLIHYKKKQEQIEALVIAHQDKGLALLIMDDLGNIQVEIIANKNSVTVKENFEIRTYPNLKKALGLPLHQDDLLSILLLQPPHWSKKLKFYRNLHKTSDAWKLQDKQNKVEYSENSIQFKHHKKARYQAHYFWDAKKLKKIEIKFKRPKILIEMELLKAKWNE